MDTNEPEEEVSRGPGARGDRAGSPAVDRGLRLQGSPWALARRADPAVVFPSAEEGSAPTSNIPSQGSASRPAWPWRAPQTRCEHVF